MTVLLCIAVLLCAIPFLYVRQSLFGRQPAGERLERIKRSANFKNGRFENIHYTPQLTEGYNIAGVLFEFLFKRGPRLSPEGPIPVAKVDLLQLPPEKNALVWFGHSSYFMQLDGKRILVDPVFSGNASPLPRTNKAFPGTDVYTVADLPEVDYLFITHDHYDHVDYATLLALQPKVKTVLCGLGVGAHFERWGYSPDRIVEKDWYETVDLGEGFTVHTAPTRHFSGRGFARNNTLWVSFILQTPSMKFYLGGDSGYDTHFADIGNRYGPFDLAILDNGQYDPKWRYIHMRPEEVLQAAHELKARRLFPVHSCKFVLANHPWDEPLDTIARLNKGALPLVTPVIGTLVDLDDPEQTFAPWWETTG